MDEGQIVLLWGGGLFVYDGIKNGMFSDLWNVISQPGQGSGNSNYLWVWGGEVLALIILYAIAGTGSNLPYWFLGAVTLLFLIQNIPNLQPWLAKMGL